MFSFFSRDKGGEPTPNRCAQRFDFQPAMNGGKILQLQKPCVEKIPSPFPVGAGVVMKRRGHLNQALQKFLVGIGSFQPNFFPMFVSFIEVFRIERFQSLLVQVGSCMQAQSRF